MRSDRVEVSWSYRTSSAGRISLKAPSQQPPVHQIHHMNLVEIVIRTVAQLAIEELYPPHAARALPANGSRRVTARVPRPCERQLYPHPIATSVVINVVDKFAVRACHWREVGWLLHQRQEWASSQKKDRCSQGCREAAHVSERMGRAWAKVKVMIAMES